MLGFFEPKMYVASYCQIYAFHPNLNLERILILCSFQETADEIYDLSHFQQKHVAFFDRTTFFHLKDDATAEKATAKKQPLLQNNFHRN